MFDHGEVSAHASIHYRCRGICKTSERNSRFCYTKKSWGMNLFSKKKKNQMFALFKKIFDGLENEFS